MIPFPTEHSVSFNSTFSFLSNFPLYPNFTRIVDNRTQIKRKSLSNNKLIHKYKLFFWYNRKIYLSNKNQTKIYNLQDSNYTFRSNEIQILKWLLRQFPRELSLPNYVALVTGPRRFEFLTHCSPSLVLFKISGSYIQLEFSISFMFFLNLKLSSFYHLRIVLWSLVNCYYFSGISCSNRAFCYSQLELHKHVIKDCDKALLLDPTVLQAYILKGFCSITFQFR